MIIFLDIDGVICTRKGAGWTFAGRPAFKSAQRRPARAIDPGAMRNLNALCEVTGALVVVSSTWRLNRDVPVLFKRLGFTGQFHADWKTDSDGPIRSAEIGRWLEQHSSPRFVILDDKAGELLELSAVLVLTNNWCGLSAADVGRAIRVLKGDATGVVLAESPEIETESREMHRSGAF